MDPFLSNPRRRTSISLNPVGRLRKSMIISSLTSRKRVVNCIIIPTMTTKPVMLMPVRLPVCSLRSMLPWQQRLCLPEQKSSYVQVRPILPMDRVIRPMRRCRLSRSISRLSPVTSPSILNNSTNKQPTGRKPFWTAPTVTISCSNMINSGPKPMLQPRSSFSPSVPLAAMLRTRHLCTPKTKDT